jgi:polygalacturonase
MTHHITRRQVLSAGKFIAGGAALSLLLTRSDQNRFPSDPPAGELSPDSLPWPAANAIVSRVKPPVFPNRVYAITSYGARGDGLTDNTVAFQQAISDCARSGGGTVLVPAGIFVTGAIRLLSNINLHLAPGSTILFSGNVNLYPRVLTRYQGLELLNSSPMIYAYGQTNIAITGQGTLDGSLTRFWNTGESDWNTLLKMVAQGVPTAQRTFGPGTHRALRTSFINPYNCTNVLIQGITITQARFWQIHPVLCSKVLVDGVTTWSTAGNTDGCDPESCTDVVIKHCAFNAGDDCVAIKSGRGADGRRIHVPSRNIVIMHCTGQGPWGLISCGSEESGGIQHVFAYDLATVGKSVQYLLYMKANPLRGGLIEDINLDTIHASNVTSTAIYSTLAYENVEHGPFPPTFDRVSIRNMHVDSAPYALSLTGLPNDPLGSISLADSTFTNIVHPVSPVTNASSVHYTNVSINGQTITG